ncbi:pali-domain-containing protein [Hanseniaspora valbyensis NRRL Y-1626]|uniref:Pali-domain-containing protein n=1 Tax=Hanseniaspora valbyensis NRRL Y-1626 TaxID=766949 RepID=A0A1B7TK87_9ASCO|nr:pali-domain-containing protein [Hanseniaspora valbyensis NRRL Y-1626]
MLRSSALSTIIVILQFISLAFLIIAFVTVPLFKFTSNSKSTTSNLLSLSNYNGIQYGVFGYCDTSEKTCSSASANYKAYKIQEANSDDSDWKLDLSARKTLSELLIVVPVAAGVIFINFLMTTVNLVTQKRDVNENERFIFIQFIISSVFSFLSFAGAAMSCIVVFLLFYPHVDWPAWILIPSAVLSLLSIPLTFFQYLYKKNEVYNSESGATMDEKNIDVYGNGRLLSDDIGYEENLHSDYDDVDVTDDLKTKNFYTQLQKFGSENNLNNSNSDLERNSTAIQEQGGEYAKPSQLVDVMKNGSNLTLGNSSNNSGLNLNNKKDSYNLYQEYKQNEQDIANVNENTLTSSNYDSAALTGNKFRDPSGSSSRYTTANSYKQPGAIDRNNKEYEADGYSDISDSDKDFVRSNIIPKSERPALESDDGLHDDQSSNFTSVSQRAGNPAYLKNRLNAPMPQIQPQQQQVQQPYQGQYQNAQPRQVYQGQAPNQNNYARQYPPQNNSQYQTRSGPMGGFAGQPPMNNNIQPYNPNLDRVGVKHQAMNPQQRQRAPMVFQNNADFEAPVGSSYQQQNNSNVPVGGARFQPQVYKPGYKKRPMNTGAQMGPSSYSNPYVTNSAQQPYTGFR